MNCWYCEERASTSNGDDSLCTECEEGLDGPSEFYVVVYPDARSEDLP
jgi:hypothetical protein